MSSTVLEVATDLVRAHIDSACSRVAPTWPLDRFIAVNPYWGWVDQPVARAGAMLGTLAGTRLTVARSWFRDEWMAGRVTLVDLEGAADGRGDRALADDALAALDLAQNPIPRLSLITDVRDAWSGPHSSPRAGQTWTDLAIHQISQHCAASVDHHQGSWHPDCQFTFAGWRAQVTADRGIPWADSRRFVGRELVSLPADADRAIAVMLDDLLVPAEGMTAYLSALLLSVNGWAAWFAHERWQARLVGSDDHGIVDLLAVRLAWDWLLRRDTTAVPPNTWADWASQWAQSDRHSKALAKGQRVDWVLQDAAERAHQRTLISGLRSAASAERSVHDDPEVQAVFCIDVRSEVLRRSLESVAPRVRTRGFAGFFGLPIAFTPAGATSARPQLPGLLSPTLDVFEGAGSADADRGLVDSRRRALRAAARWSTFRTAPSSVFSFVESLGLTSLLKLLTASRPRIVPPDRWQDAGLTTQEAAVLRPRLALVNDDPAAAAAIADGVLQTMGLVQGFAPIVLLCGHGSQTANNPHAAGLDCGACGGQSGEVNARVLADLLNSPAVRDHLRAFGIDIPDATWFVAGLHNTTTDDIDLFDTDAVPNMWHADVEQLRGWLKEAGGVARRHRAAGLGLADIGDQPDVLEKAVRERANDWSEVRPEWGLAGNASFIVAPRSRTCHLDLGGRTFLHDYDASIDPEGIVLARIMTAPMVVTNWINLQYFASTVDNRRYGSGNKVLHNVVGGHIGVFEGNGGDLRIGLPLQSLHDGTSLRHPPLRLSVFIEAPRDRLDAVMAEHAVVRNLVANSWLHLLRIESASGAVERWTADGWLDAP